MKISIYILSFLLLFTSCKKEYHAFGKVSNPVTGNGLAGVKVEFFKSTGGLPGGFEEVTSTLTDANGNYDLKYKKTAGFVKLELGPELYLLGSLQNGTYQTALQLEKGESLNINWHAVPYGKLKTNIYNISCEGTSDSIRIDFEYRIDKNAITFGTSIKTGCYNMAGTPTSDVPMGYYDITWTVTKPSTGTNTFTGEVFVPENGIGEFTINY